MIARFILRGMDGSSPRSELQVSGDGSYAFKDLVPDSYVIGTISVTHRASGWQGKLEKDEIVNFDLEAMPPDSLSSTTTD